MKILCILYDDPKNGMPKSYALDNLPKIDKYPDGMTLPSPNGRDFNEGELLGCVSGELGLRKFLESNGHQLIVTSDKDGDGCTADKELVDADIVISQPFFPYYLTREKMESAPNLKMAITCLLYTSPSPRDGLLSRMPSSACSADSDFNTYAGTWLVAEQCCILPLETLLWRYNAPLQGL